MFSLVPGKEKKKKKKEEEEEEENKKKKRLHLFQPFWLSRRPTQPLS